MKKAILFLSAAVFAISLQAQVKFGIRGGLSTTQLNEEKISLSNGSFETLGLAIKDADYGVHLGVFLQGKIGAFVIQPEVLFNSSSVNFRVDGSGQSFDQVFKEKYQFIDIPVLLGAKFGPLRLNAGPVGHIFVNSSSDLLQFDQYKQHFETLTLGWQGGIGLDIWSLLIDLRYEGNFNKFGDHIQFGGNQYQFSQTPGRFIASVGIAF